MSNAISDSSQSPLDRRLAPSISVSPLPGTSHGVNGRAPTSLTTRSGSGGLLSSSSSKSVAPTSSTSNRRPTSPPSSNESDAEANDVIDYKRFTARTDAYNLVAFP
jgi:hypothetical protein